jgi:hypothetical protein
MMKTLGLLLLLATVGVVSCQALFADRSTTERLAPPVESAAPAGQR